MGASGPPRPLYSEIKTNLAAVKARIAAAAVAADRQPESVTLVAVTKLQPLERVEAALALGHRAFGENRVQEAKAKWPELRARFEGVELHMVGHLQTNKLRDAVALFDVIESVDRPKLARSLAAELDRSGARPKCYVQINTGSEPQKSGVLPGEADAFIQACRGEFGLPVAGLMCMPPIGEEASLHFALLAKIAAHHGLGELSMGTSADFEVAVTFGARSVRVGTAVFGSRSAP